MLNYVCYNFKSQINSNSWKIHLAHGPLTYESSVYQMPILTWAMYQYVNISSWKIYSMGTVEHLKVQWRVFRCVWLGMLIQFKCFTTAWCKPTRNYNERTSWRLNEYQAWAQATIYDFGKNGFDLRCHNILLSSSVPVQSNFIFFSKESAKLSKLHKITDRHGSPCAAVRRQMFWLH